MSKKHFEELKLILKRHFTINDLKVIAPLVRLCEQYMKRVKELESKLAQIQNIKLIDENEESMDRQKKSLHERNMEGRREWVRRMKSQGLQGSEQWKLTLKSMGISEIEAEGM